MIGIIDYGLGNIKAFENIYQNLNIPAIRVEESEKLNNCSHLILPGVGAFDRAINLLNSSNLLEELTNQVIVKKKPILAVCVGMQIMADSSSEGVCKGLGWIPGEVINFNEELDFRFDIPHMGWNEVYMSSENDPLYKSIENPSFYFLHSYRFKPNNIENILTYTNYGVEFVSSVRSENIWATQFHPEKSLNWGIKLLSNFSKI